MQEMQVWSLAWEDALEKEMATHSSILAWEVPQTEKPGGLQSMGSQRVRHFNWSNLAPLTFNHTACWKLSFPWAIFSGCKTSYLSSDFSYYYLSLRLLFEYRFFKEVFSTSQFSRFSSLWLPQCHASVYRNYDQCKFTLTFGIFLLISDFFTRL